MEKRKHILIQAYTHLLILSTILILLLIIRPEIYFVFFGLAFCVYSAFKSFKLFQEAKTVNPEEKVNLDPLVNASKEEKIKHYKRIIYLGIPAFIILACWTVYDLNSLQAGEVESVSIWGPLALLYEYCGYWSAVLALPMLAVFTLSSLGLKIYRLNKTEES